MNWDLLRLAITSSQSRLSVESRQNSVIVGCTAVFVAGFADGGPIHAGTDEDEQDIARVGKSPPDPQQQEWKNYHSLRCL